MSGTAKKVPGGMPFRSSPAAQIRMGAVCEDGPVTTWQEWDGEAVMNGHLPDVPEGEPPAGLWVPLARWWKPEGAVGYLLIVMLDPEPDDHERSRYKADIDTFIRDEGGRWRWRGVGGSDWRFGWPPRPQGTSFWLEGMGSADGAGQFVAPGLAQSEVATVLVRGNGWETASRVESQTGAFLIGADIGEPIEISTLDGSGRTLRSFERTTIMDALPSHQ